MDIARKALREPQVDTPREYARHVRILGGTYFVLFFTSVAGIWVIVSQGKLFVTLAQRSNVETLTLAFLILYFFYLGILSFRGVWALSKVATFWLLGFVKPNEQVEKMRAQALGAPASEDRPTVALNVIIEAESRPHQEIEMKIEDRFGSLGHIRIRGARMEHHDAPRSGSYTLFPYITRMIQKLLRERGEPARLDIVEWLQIDDESLEKYLGQVEFARKLSRHFQCEEFWPTIRLRAEDIQKVERELSEICQHLRNELLFPQWEYSGDHKLPIIPEPLGIISLSRSEKRVDPIASMGAAALVSMVILALALWMVFYPPWVPGVS
jgi:hypothetical protein